jgi:hypothetical protein
MYTKFWSENLKGRELGRPKRRWEDIRLDFRKTGWEDVEWMHRTQDKDQWRAVVNIVMNFRVP